MYWNSFQIRDLTFIASEFKTLFLQWVVKSKTGRM